jgi:hypothetical protein
VKKISKFNIVDTKLDFLIRKGKLAPTRDNLYNQEYWDKFISMCDDEIVDFILSFPQSGHWNGWLYAACEKRRGLKPNR